ncbi:MAG: type III-A CRISPR-associated RAMP protein Csm3, partial [Tissierellia bacterium]|nr:type III-A CRISPR-associated RAMP protein Csm3 [Tissierellia bacterium]
LDSGINHNNDDPKILRLFGSSNDKNTVVAHKSRFYFSDSFICNREELEGLGLESFTEVKFENTIDRFTAVANPRQIERVIRGTEFELNLIYNVEEKDEIIEDFQLLKEGLDLLKYDYLGGHGSRGYGRIEFVDLSCEKIIGDVDENTLAQIKEIFG